MTERRTNFDLMKCVHPSVSEADEAWLLLSVGFPRAGGGASEGGEGAVVTSKYVWQKFREGCSLRMPCPQKFSDPLHVLLSALEEEFGCMVGSNAYLTPPRSQGFAPHWDDIEAFLLQVLGVGVRGEVSTGSAVSGARLGIVRGTFRGKSG